MDIPDAAIEAAAKAMYPYIRDPASDDWYVECARIPIEAAIPAIREAIAQEIEAEITAPNSMHDLGVNVVNATGQPLRCTRNAAPHD